MDYNYNKAKIALKNLRNFYHVTLLDNIPNDPRKSNQMNYYHY